MDVFLNAPLVILLSKETLSFLLSLQKKINRVMKMAENNDVRIPMIKVVANPLIGPDPKTYNTIPVRSVVTLASMMEL